MALGQPTPRLEQQVVIPLTAVLLDCRGAIPALNPFDPYRIDAVFRISELGASGRPVDPLVDRAKVHQGTREYSDRGSPVIHGCDVALRPQDIGVQIVQVGASVGKKHAAQRPLDIFCHVSAVSPGPDHIDYTLDLRFRALPAENPACKSRSVDDPQRAKIIEETEQVGRGDQGVTGVPRRPRVAGGEVSARRTKNLDPCFTGPRPV
jgi:hypothetical protein